MPLDTKLHNIKAGVDHAVAEVPEVDEEGRPSAVDANEEDVPEPPIAPSERRTRRALSLRSTFMPPAQLFRADVLLNRLREFGVMGTEEEDMACVVDVKNVYQELPPFLKDMLPVWNKDEPHSHYITYFKHDRHLVRSADRKCLIAIEMYAAISILGGILSWQRCLARGAGP